MSELNIKMVPLSAIDYAINEASEGWNQFLDTEEMKVVAIPEDPEEMDDLYIPDEEIEKLVIEDKEGVRAYGTIWCQAQGFSVFDDLNLIGLDRQ